MKRAMALERVRAAGKPPSTSPSGARPATSGSAARPKQLGSSTTTPTTRTRRKLTLGGRLAAEVRSRASKRVSPATIPLTFQRAISGGIAACEEKVLKPLTQAQYIARRNEFNEWVRRERRGSVDLELNLLDYLDKLLSTGEKAAVGEKVVAAVLHSHPGVKRSDLKRVHKALQGFRQARPAQSRYPIPEEVMQGI